MREMGRTNREEKENPIRCLNMQRNTDKKGGPECKNLKISGPECKHRQKKGGPER